MISERARSERRDTVATKLVDAADGESMVIDLTLDTGPLLRTGEVALLFGVSEHSIRKWADDGKLPCIRTLGRHRLFPAREIAKILREATQQLPRADEPNRENGA